MAAAVDALLEGWLGGGGGGMCPVPLDGGGGGGMILLLIAGGGPAGSGGAMDTTGTDEAAFIALAARFVTADEEAAITLVRLAGLSSISSVAAAPSEEVVGAPTVFSLSSCVAFSTASSTSSKKASRSPSMVVVTVVVWR